MTSITQISEALKLDLDSRARSDPEMKDRRTVSTRSIFLSGRKAHGSYTCYIPVIEQCNKQNLSGPLESASLGLGALNRSVLLYSGHTNSRSSFNVVYWLKRQEGHFIFEC